jgi:hypothetical protein
VTERVQLLRGGQALPYVVTEEHGDGSLLLAPEPIPMAEQTVPAEDARAAAVAVPAGDGTLQVRDLTVAYGPKMAVDAVSEYSCIRSVSSSRRCAPTIIVGGTSAASRISPQGAINSPSPEKMIASGEAAGT